jgi:tRNA (guanine-N7-)-methyltransferase
VREREINNLYFLFGNANNILNDVQGQFIIKNVKSISFNFPDPWFKKRHYKRRVVQPEFINIISNSLKKGSLIFIKTDVKDLFDYMDCIISSNFNFKKIDTKDFNYSQSFNPYKVKTNREKYVIVNQLDIFESIYIKI